MAAAAIWLVDLGALTRPGPLYPVFLDSSQIPPGASDIFGDEAYDETLFGVCLGTRGIGVSRDASEESQ